MKTSPTKPATTVAGKRGKHKTRAKASMGNLFQMEEEDLALLLDGNISIAADPSPSKEVTPDNEGKTGVEKSKSTSAKRSSGYSRSHSKSTTSDNRTLSTNSELASGGLKKGQKSVDSDQSTLTAPLLIGSETSYYTRAGKKCISTPNVSVNEDNFLNRYSFRELDNSIIQDKESQGEYSQEMTNEELDGVSKQMSTELSKDLSFELTDEFIVELSDLEFGDAYAQDQTPKSVCKDESKDELQPDRVAYNKGQVEELEAQDESFELADNFAAIADKDLSVEAEAVDGNFNIPFDKEKSNQINKPEPSKVEKEPHLENQEDEKFDLDELINAGTNSYSKQDYNNPYSSGNQIEENEISYSHFFNKSHENGEPLEGNVAKNEEPNPSSLLSNDTSFDITLEDQNQLAKSDWRTLYNKSNYLPFGKAETIQQVLQAWAFGDTVALIKMGNETSLEDDPFYSGDDEDFSCRRTNSQTETATKVEVNEHPLARYGLKVRTINAIELVGKKNYYSLTEESRKELELLVQDLSKTEEGTARNQQLQREIFSMFE